MSDSIEKQQQPSLPSTATEVCLFGEGEHTHSAPREKLTGEEIRNFAGKQEEAALFTDDYHLIQVWKPEDLKRSPLQKVQDTCSKLLGHPAALPLAPGHYRLRFQCGGTETMVDWPEEQTEAYFAKFAKEVGYHYTSGFKCTPAGRVYINGDTLWARVVEGMRLAHCYDTTFVQYIQTKKQPSSRASGR